MAGDSSEIRAARELVLRQGWNTTSFQILNPGIDLWFSRARDAVVGFVRKHGVRVVAGAPVCSIDRLVGVVREFETEARGEGARVCYVAAQRRLLAAVSNLTHRGVLVGAQPVLRPREWDATLRARASLRAQLQRARNKGIRVEEWAPERASADTRLSACLDEWLAGRGLPALHFLVEPRTLERLPGRRVFVAQRDRALAGFLVLSPVPRRNGWLVEQIVRGRVAPNGTAELLVDTAIRGVAAEGATFFTLGGAPLSRRAHDSPDTAAPPWLRLGFAWLRAHGRRFFDTGGLESFKAKFRPADWEPLYLVTNDLRLRPTTVYAVAAAFTGRSPIRAGTVGAARAARAEISWLLGRRRARPIRRVPATAAR